MDSFADHAGFSCSCVGQFCVQGQHATSSASLKSASLSQNIFAEEPRSERDLMQGSPFQPIEEGRWCKDPFPSFKGKILRCILCGSAELPQHHWTLPTVGSRTTTWVWLFFFLLWPTLPALLFLLSGVTSSINYLHPSPCLRFCCYRKLKLIQPFCINMCKERWRFASSLVVKVTGFWDCFNRRRRRKYRRRNSRILECMLV